MNTYVGLCKIDRSDGQVVHLQVTVQSPDKDQAIKHVSQHAHWPQEWVDASCGIRILQIRTLDDITSVGRVMPKRVRMRRRRG